MKRPVFVPKRKVPHRFRPGLERRITALKARSRDGTGGREGI